VLPNILLIAFEAIANDSVLETGDRNSGLLFRLACRIEESKTYWTEEHLDSDLISVPGGV